MHRAIGAVLAAATIGLAACGGSSNDNTTAHAASTSATPAPSTSPAPSTTATTSGVEPAGRPPATTAVPSSARTPAAAATSHAGATAAAGATNGSGGATQPKAPAAARPGQKPPTSTTAAKPRSGSTGGKTPAAKPAKPAKSADPLAAAKAQVVVGFDAGFKAYEHCIVAPESCDFATASADGSPLRVWLVQNIFEKMQYHLRARPGSGPMTYKVEGVKLAPGGKSATVATCVVDGMVVYDVANPFNPNDDIVFNDRLVATRTSWTMSLTRVGWRRSAAHVVKEWVGKDRCS